MSKRFIKILVAVLASLLWVNLALSAAAEKDKTQGLQKTTTNDDYSWFTINNLFNWYGNNGNQSYNIATGNSGLEFPKNSGKTAVFEDGVIWGGFHKGRSDPKVGGDAYRYGLQAGRILTAGGPLETDTVSADDPEKDIYRVFRVRADVSPTTQYADVKASLESESELISRYQNISASALFAAYQKDWNEWPAKSASNPAGLAPFTDLNGNGTYEPGVDIPGQKGADQTLYYVANDASASRTTKLYFSPPIGIEVHKTVWGYDLQGALANTVFSSTLLINKSGAPLDSAFLVMWSDVDLGEAADDYAGCDVARNLGFVYNGINYDNTYGTEVPATGYTFFQGPVVPGVASDSAVFQLKYRHGFKNLPMTTFVFFINGSSIYTDPPQGTAGGDVQWYRLMNGLISSTGAPFVDPTTGQPSKYTLYGDPLSGKGWLDGTYGLTPGDRRICLVSGPFTLADKDTQELVVATIVALGGDRISSVGVLKWYSDLAQSAYNTLFNISKPPPAPKVVASALDGKITLTWADTSGNTKIETWNSNGYKFEGYTVYQFPGSNPDVSTGIRLANYDLLNSVTTIFYDAYDPGTGYVISKPVHFGSDNGLKRSYSTGTDAITKGKLLNGTPYYFGVAAYSFNGSPTAKPSSLESTPALLTITPQWDTPGYRYSAALGDTLKQIVHSGPSDGIMFPVVVDPTSLPKNGATYTVSFTGSVPSQTWAIKRTIGTTTTTVATGVTDQSASDAGAVIVDGIDFRVVGAPLSFKYFLTVSNANGPLSPFQPGSFAFNTSGFPLPPSGADRPDGPTQQPGGLTASKGWGIHTGMNATDMSASFANFLNRVTNNGARWSKIIPYDFEMRFTAAGGKALFPDAFTGAGNYLVDVPFELWNIGIGTPDNTSDDYRMFPNILDVDNSHTFNLLTKAGTDSVDNGGGGATHSISGGANDPFTDWVYWVAPVDKTPGQSGYNAIVTQVQNDITSGAADPYLNAATTGGSDVIRRMVLVGWNFGTVATGTYAMQMPQTGTTFRIVSTKPNTPSDSFVLTVPASTQGSTVAKADADRVNVFPNPYIGFNPQEANKYQRFVTFTHLPVNATLRVFNLAGVLVRTLQKDDPSQFFQWDLRNEQGFPVAAGMYIVHVDMPGVGKTKTLKLGVIPEQQFIDKW